VKTKTHFACRVDIWDAAGNNLVEHLAGLDDLTAWWWPPTKLSWPCGQRTKSRSDRARAWCAKIGTGDGSRRVTKG
jgi:hypothetical protein